MRQRILFFLWSVMLCLVVAPTASAIDHSNLDESRPLRLEDAYPIASGEWALETGGGFAAHRQGSTRGLFPVEILYGVAPNLHVAIGTTVSTDPHKIEGQTKSGDVHLSGLYNFNQETLTLPAFGLKLALDLPTGTDSSGTDVRVKGLVTKSFDRLRAHFNPAYEVFTGTKGAERDSRYEFALGASYPLGAPHYTRLTVLGDVFTEQSFRQGESPVVGTEFGIRHQLTPRTVVDAGIGTEFAGPADRAVFFGTVGVSFGF